MFEQSLRERLLAGELKTNLEAYLFALNEGFLLKDANSVLKDLKEKKKIDFDFPLISSKMHQETISQIKMISHGAIKH